jgi:hypothetical protein
MPRVPHFKRTHGVTEDDHVKASKDGMQQKTTVACLFKYAVLPAKVYAESRMMTFIEI